MKKEESKEQDLYEYLQEDLEKHTEYLSSLYEKDMDEIISIEDFFIWKEEMANYTRVTASFLDKFIEGVVFGLLQS